MWLLLLLGLPALVGILRWGDRRARARLETLLGARAGEHVEGANPRLHQWRRFLLICCLFWLIVAIARPQWGANEVVVKQKGTDIVIALDISNSMLAEDVPPSRIERAKAELADFLGRLPRGRIGLVLFAGSAFVQCPLTLDYGTAQIFLRMAAPDMLSEQGTAIGSALAAARELLQQGGERQTADAFRAIVLVTDGEDLEGEWEKEVSACRDEGIVVLPVGVGLETGGLIPVLDDKGRPAGFMKDQEGNVVLTRLDLASLEKIAGLSGGTTFRLGADGLAGQRLHSILTGLGERELEERRISAFEERFFWPLILAFGCLLARLLLRPRRRAAPRTAALPAALIGFWLALGSPLLTSDAAAGLPVRPPGAGEADEGRRLFTAEQYEEALRVFETARANNPDDPRLSLAVGEALFRLGRFEEADTEFQRALTLSRSADLRAESLYNGGTSRLAQGDPGGAAELLMQSLRLGPDQLDARHNLELALQQVQQQQQQQQQEQQDQNECQKPDQNQEQQGKQSESEQQEDSQPQESPAGQDQPEQEPPGQESPPPEPEEPQPAQEDEEQSSSQEEKSEEEMSTERALAILRALDRDEEELKRSVEKRLKGGRAKSGKRW